MPRFTQHAALDMLLEQRQYESCRMVAERMIDDLMVPIQLVGAPQDQPAEAVLKQWQGRDLELACLHITLSKCLLGLSEYESAASKADAAALLARKVGDVLLLTEALHVAGVCYSQAANYRLAVDRLTSCLTHATGVLRAKALYNRGHVFDRKLAFRYAAQDYEEALRQVHDVEPGLARLCRINLAWDLIVLRDFDRAEEIMVELASASGADADQLLQLQLKHDRLHMACLKREGKDALKQALQALRQAGDAYPHVTARIALSLLALASEENLPEQAFSAGILAKHLASRAQRPDIDEEASRAMRMLESEVGTDYLIPPLQRTGELTAGALRTHKTKRGHSSGGAG